MRFLKKNRVRSHFSVEEALNKTSKTSFLFSKPTFLSHNGQFVYITNDTRSFCLLEIGLALKTFKLVFLNTGTTLSNFLRSFQSQLEEFLSLTGKFLYITNDTRSLYSL